MSAGWFKSGGSFWLTLCRLGWHCGCVVCCNCGARRTHD